MADSVYGNFLLGVLNLTIDFGSLENGAGCYLFLGLLNGFKANTFCLLCSRESGTRLG